MSGKMGRPTVEAKDPTMGDRAVELYRELGNADKVGKVLGCGRNAVTRMLKARGVVMRPGWDCDLGVGDVIKCAGCGIDRTINMSRGYPPHCIACRPHLGESRNGGGIRCGTVDGYRQHRTYGQPPCKPCRVAVRGMEQPDPFLRCRCGKLIRTSHSECAMCRRGITPKAKVAPALLSSGPDPVIRWAKDRHGIWRGIVQHEPQPDREHAEPVVVAGPSGYNEQRVKQRIAGDRSCRLRKGERAA